MHPHLVSVAAAHGGVFTAAQAQQVGYTERDIRRRVADGTWARLRRGVFTEGPMAAQAAGDQRRAHLLQAAAALVGLRNDAVLSHRSAALAHGLPLVGPPPTEVALTIERQHRRRAPGLELHVAVTPSHHRAAVENLPVTSVARTVSDLARSQPFKHAVVAADAALQRRLCTSADLRAIVDDCWVWPGIARTKRVIEFADGRSESPGESLSRVAIAAAGLPVPDLQVELLLSGRRVRADFMWVEQGVVGEFDGRIKYERAEDLWDEKLREDLIRRHDHRVVRWTWRDVYPDPAPMLRRVAAALAA